MDFLGFHTVCRVRVQHLEVGLVQGRWVSGVLALRSTVPGCDVKPRAVGDGLGFRAKGSGFRV